MKFWQNRRGSRHALVACFFLLFLKIPDLQQGLLPPRLQGGALPLLTRPKPPSPD